MRNAALAAELEAQLVPRHCHVTAPQRRQAERAVVACVLVVADADQRALEQPDHRCQHLVARQLGKVDVTLDTLADERQDLAERHHAAELRLVTNGAILRVIPILLPPPRVSRRDLQVSGGIRADPDFSPPWRNDQLPNAVQLRSVLNDSAVGSDVDKAAAATLSTDAWGCVRHVAKASCFRGFDVLVGGNHVAFKWPGAALRRRPRVLYRLSDVRGSLEGTRRRIDMSAAPEF